MGLKLHCIFENSSVLPDIVKLVEKTAHKLNSKKKSAKVADVYNELRDQGFEIDAESVAFAYENVQGIIGRKGFSTAADIHRFGGQGMKSAILLANKGDIVKARLGRENIPTAVTKGIANTFATLRGRNDVDKSRLFQLQELMKKKAFSMLDKSKFPSPEKMSFVDVLKAAFDVENIPATVKEAMKGRVKGTLNKIDEVWEGIQEDIDEVASHIKDKAERDKFLQMTDAIRNSSYELLITSGQGDEVVKGLLKERGFTKTINRNGNPVEVIDWQKVLADRTDWRKEFTSILANNGFSPIESARIIKSIEGNYERLLTNQAKATLKKLANKKNRTTPIKDHALERLVKYKNAGINLPANRQALIDAMGINIPKEIADEVMGIISDYEDAINKFGNISNVYIEEVVRSIRNLLSGLDDTTAEKVINGLNDYIALKATSTIATAFNSLQNITSGMMAATMPTISAVLKTKNLKLITRFLRSWVNAFADVSAGGVTIRDARTVNALEQLQGRGGLSDRWNFQSAKGFFGKVKATLNLLGQITATAADAANGTVIYQAGMMEAVKDVLRSRGKSKSEANKIVDNMMFGDHKTAKHKDGSPMSNREFWNLQALDLLKQTRGVTKSEAKASRIADELIWHQLITENGIMPEELKAMQSASLAQKSRNLGHQADVLISPGFWLNAITQYIDREATRAKDKGDRAISTGLMLGNTAIKAANMFVGGIGNWAVLALQNSPIGVAQAGLDVMIMEMFNKSGTKPLYRQQLAIGDPDHLADQLEARKKIAGRLERGVYGTILQGSLAWLLMAMIGDDDDDDDRKQQVANAVNDLIKDPNTKRFVEKAMPIMLASELSYAYDEKKKQIDPKKLSSIYFIPRYADPTKERYFQNLANHIKKDAFARTGYQRLNESYEFNDKLASEQKRNEANSEATWRYVGELLQIPYTAWWKTVNKEYKVVESGFTPDPKARANQKKEFKENIKQTDGAIDAFMDGVNLDYLHDAFKNDKK